jgi:hypothetical protein
MEETEVMYWLTKEYAGDSPFTEETAKELWQKYRDKVEHLPQRTPTPPTCLTDRTQKERYEEDCFIKKHAKKPHILRVVKLDDPSKLVIHQLMVVLPQSERYLSAMKDHSGRVRTSLGRGLSFEGVHPKARKEGNRLIKPMPHAEFSVTRSDQEDFDVREEDRHIAVKEFDGRTLLSAGYHRAHISMYRSAPEETVLPLFAALESDVDGFLSCRCSRSCREIARLHSQIAAYGFAARDVLSMRFHKLPLQVSNSLGPLIIKFEISDGPASACIHGRWFHQWQLRFVESHQLIANLSPVCGQQWGPPFR